MKKVDQIGFKFLSALKCQSGNLLSALFVLLISAIFIVPLSPGILDILLAVNILIALVMLTRSLLVEEAFKFYSFPTLLLITTLFRLGLNISSTRLILLNGEQGTAVAGQVIRSFGEYVVSGNFVVGAIIFAIIAIVNFMVIAKGSQRVAEVSARFSLDAMPGRQLAIDADLRTGNIDKEQAQLLREDLTSESRFYGAMDGAMKFVQGDAVAGLIITFVNAVGGVSLGLSRGLEFKDALAKFGILTVGDGLVSIIPSLLISVSAGFVVTRIANKQKDKDSESLAKQLFARPEALLLSACLLLVIAVMPGFPTFPFALSGGVLLLVLIKQLFSESKISPQSENLPALLGGTLAEQRTDGIFPLGLILEVDSELLAKYLRSNSSRLENISNYAQEIRLALLNSKGLPLPNLTLSVGKQLSAGEYRILLRGNEVFKGEVNTSESYYLISRYSEASLVPLNDSFLMPLPKEIVGVSNDSLSESEEKEIEKLDVSQYLVLRAYRLILNNADQAFGIAEVKSLVSLISAKNKTLIEEVFTKGLINYAELTLVLQRLAQQGVPIGDLVLILESIAKFDSTHKNLEDRQEWLETLLLFLRKQLAKTIVADTINSKGQLSALMIDSSLEDELRSAMGVVAPDSKPAISPEMEKALISQIAIRLEETRSNNNLPLVILCSQDVLAGFYKILFSQFEDLSALRVLGLEELNNYHKLDVVGEIALEGMV